MTLVEVVVVRSNVVIYDYPVERLVRSLNRRYSLKIFGWNRDGIPKGTIKNYFADLGLFNLKAPKAKPTLVPYYPIFWLWVLLKLFIHRPKIVHSIDLDTIVPSLLYKLIFRKKVLFSVFDRYAMCNIPRKYGVLYSLVDSFEDILSNRADILVTISEKLLLTFKRRPKKCAIIMNLPEEHHIKSIESEGNKFIIVTTGPIFRTRGYHNIASAIKDLNDVEFVFAGRVYDKDLLDEILQQSNVRYKGLLLPTDALSLEASSHIMIVLYDLKVPINNYALPCKMFEAMMCGIPIITNLAPDLVSEIGYGIVVDYDNIEEIKSAITTLRDDVEFRRKLGNNGRRAFVQKYNWVRMEEKLYDVHDALLGKRTLEEKTVES